MKIRECPSALIRKYQGIDYLDYSLLLSFLFFYEADIKFEDTDVK